MANPQSQRPKWQLALALTIGLALGWISGSNPFTWSTRSLQASFGDRSGETIAMTAVVSSYYNPATKINVEYEGLFLLDYKTGRLLVSVPSTRTIGKQTKALSPFAERDLVKDFSLEPGSQPKFLMVASKTQEGTDLVLIIENTSGKIGTYRLNTSATDGKSALELVEMGLVPLNRRVVGR